MVEAPVPKVSVCVVTYNHEKFIGGCLQSLVSQQTSFPFEVIVGDDASTDTTREIIDQYAKLYPQIIRAVYREKNVGPESNYIQVHEMARGEYIAHLDGDDYALPGKLQAQADFLDLNAQYDIVWHRMKILYPGATSALDDLFDLRRNSPSGYGRSELLRFITIGLHSSKMYRSRVRALDRPPFHILDLYCNVHQLGATGRAQMLDSPPLGVYRAGVGVASSGSWTNVLLCETLDYFLAQNAQDRLSISCIAVLKSLGAARHRRWAEFWPYFKLALKSMTWQTPLTLWSDRKFHAMLRFPRRENH